MDALAAESFLNAPHKVCGLRMRPLSLGHAFTLEAIGSPFYDGRLGTPHELQLAAWVCSRPPLAIPDISSIRCRLWMLRRFNFASEVANWRAYVEDFCSPPQLWNSAAKPGEPAAEPSKVPTHLSTAVCMMRLGMTEAQAWATPVGAAFWYHITCAEQESGSKVDIVTDAEREAIARARERKEAGHV
jgi:hypothetical protein